MGEGKQFGYIVLGAQKLHYIKTGAGEKLLLCFHGYRNNANLFLPLAAYLSHQYTIISIDLPHHGDSQWPDDRMLHPDDLATMIKNLCAEYTQGKVSLAGYSMGGRVCLKIAELLPEYVEKVLLIASDGLTFNPLYYFVTRTGIGKYLFRSFLSRPQRYSGIIDWAKRRNFIDASRHKFVMQYISNTSERALLLKIWPAMCLLIPKDKKLKAAINKHRIPVYIFMGKHDPVIPVRLASKFMKDLQTVKLHVVDKGHRVFDPVTMPQMAQCLLS